MMARVQVRTTVQDESGNLISDTTQPVDVPDWVVTQDQITQRIDQIVPNLQQWVQNNPNGAVLNAAQTRLLIRLVIGLAKMVRGQLDDATGT